MAVAREPLTTVVSYDFESGLSGWVAAATSGTCSWQVLTNPQTMSVSSAINPFAVTLADNGAHLAPLSGSKVIWFGAANNGTFLGTTYPTLTAKGGGTSAVKQTGTITSPAFSLSGATKAQLEFDSWWEIEGTAAAAYDLMTVLVSTNGSTFTQVAKLNPAFAAQQPADAAYSSGGPAAVPVWRHYVYDLSAYAGQTSVQVRFMFDSNDQSYNAFRSFTVDNVLVNKGNVLPGPTITSVAPNIATANDLVTISGSGFLGGAVFTIGTTVITAANITQFGANEVIFRVPSMTAGTYAVKVVNVDGQEFTLPNAFTYSGTASPTISTVSPNTANVAQAKTVTINGSNFLSGATVMVGDYAATSVSFTSSAQLSVTVPGLPAGTYNVIVTNPTGQAGTKFAAYTVADTSTLALTSPNGGQSWAAGSTQNITWTQSGGSLVTLALYKNGVFVSDIAASISASLGTYAWAIPAATAAGTDYRVRIYNPAGTTTVTSAANFTITASPPISTSATLNSSSNPSVPGGAVTFTATISPSNATGAVQFIVDGANFGSPVAVSAGSASSAATTTLSLGSHSVTANFVGTAPYSNSTASLTQLVGGAPIAAAQSLTTDEDTAIAVTLAATDADPLTYEVVSGPSHGSLSGTAPNLTYTPAANYFGSDAFTFKANDGTYDSNVATVSLTVTAVNDAPVANSATVSLAEDGSFVITLSATDADGDTLTYTIGTPANGTLSGTAPNFTYTPNANFFGTDAFTFTVSDGTTTSAAATISISVSSVNDAPVASSASHTTAEDTAVAITLLAGDVDGDALTYNLGTPAHGTLSGAAPNLIYTPAANYNGSDAFTFTVSDGASTSAPATISITVTATNDAPIANAGSFTTAEDTAVAITLSASDLDGDALTYNVGTPSHGTLSGTAPNLTYTPSANYTGSDSFTFTVSDGIATSAAATISLTITSVNDTPVATAASFTTAEDTALSITLSATDADGDTLTYTAGTPSHGTLTGTAPNLTYTPEANYNGSDSFTFTVSDGTATSTAATISISITATNDAPIANSASSTTDEDTAVAITLSASDVDQDALTYTVSTPAHGTLSGTAPNLTYTPSAHFNGSDSFTFTVNDGTESSAVATISITVTSVNDAPIANAGSFTTNEDTAVSITLTGSDDDGDTLTWNVGTPSHGTLSGTAPNLTYTPNADFNGSDAFTFTVSDGTATSQSATISISVTATNDAPVANAGSVTTNEDTATVITLSASDIDGDALTYAVGTPGHGTLSGTAPNLTYSPAADFNGSDSFTFTVNDGSSTSSPATISITVTAVNDAPVANAQSLNGNEDTAMSVQLTGSDLENSALTFTVVANPSNGTLSGSAPNLTYTPNTNFHGTDSFTFRVSDGDESSNTATVTLNIAAQNDAPVSMSGSASTSEDQAVSITLGASDVDGDTLTYTVLTQPAHGTLSGTGAQRLYTPNANYFGADSFTFIVDDGSLDSNEATVTLNITSVNDAPTAAPFTVTLDEDTETDVTLLAVDVDGDSLTYTVVAQPQHGTLTGSLPNLRYAPNADFNGDDTFTFKANDGTTDSDVATITLTVAPINDAPVATSATIPTAENTPVQLTLAGTDVDADALTFTVVDQPSHGTLTGTSPDFTYTPEAAFNGVDTFTFKANDGALDSAVVTIRIEVDSVNDAPVASAQSLSLAEDIATGLALNATDIDGDALTYLVISAPQHGSLSGTAPNLTYTPNADFHGADSFSFVATDGELTSQPAIVSLTVTPVDDAPIANAQSASTSEDTAVAITLSGSDVDGDALTYAVTAQPSHGTVSGTAPNLTYTPAADYEGTDSFSFVAIAAGVTSSPAQVNVTINAVNDAPVAQAPSLTIDEDQATQVTLLASDVDGDTLTFTVVTAPQHGTLTGTAPNLTYTPNENYFGVDSFTFIVNDGTTDSAEVTVSFTVNAVNDAPVADAQSLTVDEDASLALTLTGSDVENDALTFTVVRSPAHGTLTGTAPDFTYAPAADFNGTDSFTFVANDGRVDSSEQTVQLTVRPVNDAPIANAQRLTAREDVALTVTLTGSDVDGDALTFAAVWQPANGTLSGTAPNLTYTPNANFHGDDSFTFIANDGQLDSAVATITISVGGTNDAPVAHDATAEVSEDDAVAITLTADDLDGDALSFTVITGPQHGTLTGTGAERMYEPAANYFGSDSFTFRANDGQADSQLATITITVKPVDDAPVATSQRVTVMQDEATEVKLHGEDLEGAALTWNIVTAPAHGTITGEAPNLVYKPAVGFSGDDAFTFTVSADGVSSSPETVSIQVLKASYSFTGGGVGCSSTGTQGWGWLAALFAALLMLRRKRSLAVVAAAALPMVAQAQEQSLTLPQIDSQSLHLNAGAADSLVTQGGLLLKQGQFRASLSAQYEYQPLVFNRNGAQVGSLISHRVSSIATLAYAPLPWLEVNADLPVALYQQGDSLQAYGLAQPTTTAFGTTLIQARAGVLQQRRDLPIDLTVGVGLLLPLGTATSLTSEAGVGIVPRVGIGRQLLPWLRVGADVGVGLRPTASYGDQAINRNTIEAAAVVHTMGLPVNAELSYRFIGSLGGAPIGSELLAGGRWAFAKRFETFAVTGLGLGSGAGTPAFRVLAGVAVAFDFAPVVTPPAPVVVEPVVVAPPPPPPEPVVVVEPEPAPVIEPEAVPEEVAVVNEELKEAMVGTQLFKTGTFTLDETSTPTLDRVAKLVQEGPASQRVRVEGFTDSSGPRDFNISLSLRRAEVVKKALIERGVAPERIEAIGVGPDRPIAPNDTKAGREANRRFEITLVP